MMMIITYALRNQPVNMNDAVEYVWHMTRENFSMYHTSNTTRSIFRFEVLFWSCTLAKVSTELYLRLRQLLPERSHKDGFPRRMVDRIVNTATMVIKWTFLLISFKILIELKAIISPNIRLTTIEAGFLDLNKLFLQP